MTGAVTTDFGVSAVIPPTGTYAVNIVSRHDRYRSGYWGRCCRVNEAPLLHEASAETITEYRDADQPEASPKHRDRICCIARERGERMIIQFSCQGRRVVQLYECTNVNKYMGVCYPNHGT